MSITRINPEYQPKGSYAAASHTHPMLVYLWRGSTGSNTYVDIPVTNLSNAYRRQGIWAFVVPNVNGHGMLYYIGISDSGDILTTQRVFGSASSISLTATADKSRNVVRVSTGIVWSTVIALSDLQLG